MPRANTRNLANESQPLSQRQTRGKPNIQAADVYEDGDGESEDRDRGEDEEMDDTDGNGIERKAHELVRLALFTEYRRTALKRQEVTKKVFGTPPTKNEFQKVFERAQHTLRKTFAMELHEIMSRAERDRADATREGANAQEGESNVTGLKKKVATTSSKQYILRSILDPTVIEAANFWDAEIAEAEAADIAALYPNTHDRRPEGTIIAWNHAGADQLDTTGILHVILALILVNGRVLTDMQLRTYLKRLRLPMGSVLPSSQDGLKPLTIDTYLTQLLKQSYLDKQTTSLASNQGGGQKRARGGPMATGRGDDGDTSFEWKWGTRAIAEIGEEGVGAFVVDFIENIEREREARRAGEEGARENGRKERERLEKRKEKLVTSIGRAAGGGLVPFK